MSIGRFSNPILPAIILAGLMLLSISLHAQDPEPTCDGCNAESVGGVIHHYPGCPYGGGGIDEPDEPDEPDDFEPWIPVPPPESKFDREKRELLNRLNMRPAASSSFTERKHDLLSRMKSGSPAETNQLKAHLKAASLRNAYHEDPEVAAAAGELALKTPKAVAEVKQAIDQRLAAPNKDIQDVIRSIKVKAPPKLVGRFDNLIVGDVLLVRSADSKLSGDYWVRWFVTEVDNFMTGTNRSRAYHTFMFVKEVKGVKLFLDNMPHEGTRIKTEAQIQAEYGMQDFDVARPVKKFDADDLWKAASEAGIKSLKFRVERLNARIDKTDYGIWGDDQMVCSETSRWAMMQAKLIIPEVSLEQKPFIDGSDPIDKIVIPDSRAENRSWLRDRLSEVKRAVIKFGPADFYLATDNFLVTPLEKVTPQPIKATRPK